MDHVSTDKSLRLWDIPWSSNSKSLRDYYTLYGLKDLELIGRA